MSKWASKFLDEAAERAKSRLPVKSGQRLYAAAQYSRLTAGWIANTGSADSELWSSLDRMRARSRQLVRDNSYAKRAKVIVVNNVVGSGISMEPQVRAPRGKLIAAVNDDIERAWEDWSQAENCHTGGKLCFADMERQAFGQIFEAGEVLFRKHYQQFGSSKVPFALELIEPERLAEQFTGPAVEQTGFYRMGVERDEFGRPLAYWIRKYHPGEVRYAGGDPNVLYRTPADEIFHLYIVDRWPQTRGEPWLASAMRRLNDMDGYAEAEITAARSAACYMGFVETPGVDDNPMDATDVTDSSGNWHQAQFDLEPGAVQELGPGQKFNFAAPNRPNAQMDPFMRLMLREVAAGVGPSYESLSRDYSQSNYSSSRLALLDDRDLWRVFQQFFIRSFREPLHKEWLRQATFARAIPSISVGAYAADPLKYQAVSFKPRGWSWVDPTKEVDAYIKARRAGFMSVGQIVALTGGGVDLEDVWSEIKSETEDAAEKGLIFTSDPAQVLERSESDVVAQPPPAPAATAGGTTPAAEPDDSGGSGYAKRIVNLRSDHGR